MKRLVMMMLVSAFVLGMVSMSSAVEVKMKGEFKLSASWVDNPDFFDGSDDGESEDDFELRERFRLWMSFIANENLSGTVAFEVGETQWGTPDVFDLGGDGKAVEVKHAYVDFTVPGSDLKLRAGLQGVILPNAICGSPVLDDDMTGIVASIPFNDMISLSAFWLRLLDEKRAQGGDNAAHDEIDAIGAILPIKGDGFKIEPYMVYAWFGKDAMGSVDDMTGFWFGAAASIDMMDPIVIKLEGVYGALSSDTDAEEASGFYLGAEVDYKAGMVTPGIVAFYASGNDDDFSDGLETLPTISPFWGPTSFGSVSTGGLLGNGYGFIYDNPAGLAGIGLVLKDISFLEGMKHVFRIVYVVGTADEDNMEFNEEDSLWEVNFDTQYKIYDELTAYAELGFMSVDFDDVDDTTDAWKLGLGLKYKF